MKQTQTLRPDKTGKALLTVLRHLGRLHEVWPPSRLLSWAYNTLQKQLSSFQAQAALCWAGYPALRMARLM